MADSVLYIDKVWVDDDGYINTHDITDYESEIVADDLTTKINALFAPCSYDSSTDDSIIYKFSFVELLLDEDNLLVDSKVIPIKKIQSPWSKDPNEYLNFPFEEFTRSFKIEKDGLYTYVKMLVPKDEYFYDISNEVYRFQSTNNTGLYFVKDHDIYYIKSGNYTSTSSATKVTADNLWENYDQDDNAISWFSAEIFSIVNLKHCLLTLEKRLLESINFQGLKYTCDMNKESRYQRDLLLDAIRVLNWLIAKKRFTEASALLKRINSTCTDACGENLNLKSCGCGRVVR